MNPITQLPLEYLQHILQELDNPDCVSSLASLLSMNKYIASFNLPFL
jgi:hypothetical protein